MGLKETQAFQVSCDLCGTTAEASSDQGTATDNAISANFISLKAPDGTPQAGQIAWVCSGCVVVVKNH